MQLWQDGLVAMLAAIGLASLLWMVVRTVLFAKPEPRQSAAALLPAQEGGESLEQQFRTLQRLRREQGAFGMILVVDCGLNDEGRKLAKLLVREERWAALCRMDEIGNYLR